MKEEEIIRPRFCKICGEEIYRRGGRKMGPKGKKKTRVWVTCSKKCSRRNMNSALRYKRIVEKIKKIK